MAKLWFYVYYQYKKYSDGDIGTERHIHEVSPLCPPEYYLELVKIHTEERIMCERLDKGFTWDFAIVTAVPVEWQVPKKYKYEECPLGAMVADVIEEVEQGLAK